MIKDTNEAPDQKWPHRLILVRHGLSLYNEERELVNRGVLKTYTPRVKGVRNADIPLSTRGRKQAQITGKFLKKTYKNFDVIFSSPFLRARETAIVIAREFPSAQFLVDERVREKEFGVADGLTPAELKNFFPYEALRKSKEKKYYYRPIGGESYPDMNLRIWAFLNMIVREYPKTNVLVVSHSAVMLGFRKILEKLDETSLLKIDREDELKNCAIISYAFDLQLKPKPKLKLEYYNKVA